MIDRPNLMLATVAQLRAIRAEFGVPAAWSRKFDGFASSKVVETAAVRAITQVVPSSGWENLSRFKITLGVRDPDNVDPTRQAAAVRFYVYTQIENETFLRRVTVTKNDAAILYAPGRTIRIDAVNLSNVKLQSQIAIDEASPGFSRWSDVDFLSGITTETDLDIPPFCTSFTVFSPSAALAPTLKGYDANGVLVYDEVLSVPSSKGIDRIPGIDFTLVPNPGAARTHTVHYTCVG